MTHKHLYIPDVQAKPCTDFTYLYKLGKFIMHKRPDVIICAGDFADLPSLCSYDKGKKSFEGRRYKQDIAAAKKAMDALLGPMREYNKRAIELHQKQYKPRMVITLGNHEERILRVGQVQPELDGVVSYADLPYEDWEVIEYLVPIEIDGVLYVHFLANPFTGKPFGGTAMFQLTKHACQSFVAGHKQTLDIATHFTAGGRQQWGIICGACYEHWEDFKGPQGNNHFRGVIMLHDVKDGNFNPMVVSLDYINKRYK